jgi:hypothetical protein
MNANPESEHHIYGAFKGHSTIRKCMASLYRCLYILQVHPQYPRLLKTHLLGLYGATSAVIRCKAFHQNQLNDYLNGKSFRLLRSVEWQLSKCISFYPIIEQELLQSDLNYLYWFFYRNCVPLHGKQELEAFTAKKDVDQSLIRWSNFGKADILR